MQSVLHTVRLRQSRLTKIQSTENSLMKVISKVTHDKNTSPKLDKLSEKRDALVSHESHDYIMGPFFVLGKSI